MDGSDKNWSGIVMETATNEPYGRTGHQSSALPGSIGSRFTDTQERWAKYKQEAYAIFQTFKRLKYMMFCDRVVHIFTDQKNLLSTLHPRSIEPSLTGHNMSRVARWELFLSTFSYVMKFVNEDSNVFPVMLTRWMKGHRSSKWKKYYKQKRIPRFDIPVSSFGKDFQWSHRNDILYVQSKSTVPSTCVEHDIWILRKAKILGSRECKTVEGQINLHCIRR